MRKLALVAILGLALASCQKSSDIVIDTTSPINATLSYFDKDSVDISGAFGSSGSQKVTITDSFSVTLSSQDNFKYLEVKLTNDSGTVLNDLYFSNHSGTTVAASLTTTIENVYVGDISYSFTAYNEAGVTGDFAVKAVKLYNANAQAPVIESVQIPDSLKVGPIDTVKTTLVAYVSDPAGLTDVGNVYFNVTKPNGSPSSTNPNEMYDDGGLSGAPGDIDSVANDGHWTLGISLPPGTTTGTYVFTFYAVSRSGLRSYPYSKNLKVY